MDYPVPVVGAAVAGAACSLKDAERCLSILFHSLLNTPFPLTTTKEGKMSLDIAK